MSDGRGDAVRTVFPPHWWSVTGLTPGPRPGTPTCADVVERSERDLLP